MLLFFLLFSSKIMSQSVNAINKIEIYALKYDDLYITNITKKDIKKNYDQFVRVLKNSNIEESKLNIYIQDMKSYIENEYLPQDFRAILIIHRANKKKETYYIASSNAGIVDEKGIVYKFNNSFVSSVYSFLPKYFYYNDIE